VGQLGYFYDATLLQYYIRARHYRPALARWLSVDPMIADVNLYRYCGDNPVVYVDPLGYWRCEPRLAHGEPQTQSDIKKLAEYNHRASLLHGTMYTDSLLVASFGVGNSYLTLYALSTGRITKTAIFGIPLWPVDRGTAEANSDCLVGCFLEDERCYAYADCIDGNLDEPDGAWLAAVRYRLIPNGPVLTIQYGADAGFAYSGGEVTLSVGGPWVGAQVDISGGTWTEKAHRSGAFTWVCECVEE
jgi:RHS repeat-associated protein